LRKYGKEPAFFLAHPRAIAAFGRECTRRGVPPPTVNIFGSPFLTWARPLDCADRQVGDQRRQNKYPAATPPGKRNKAWSACSSREFPEKLCPAFLFVSWAFNHRAVASYLISLYCSLAILNRGCSWCARERQRGPVP